MRFTIGHKLPRQRHEQSSLAHILASLDEAHKDKGNLPHFVYLNPTIPLDRAAMFEALAAYWNVDKKRIGMAVDGPTWVSLDRAFRAFGAAMMHAESAESAEKRKE